MLNINHFENRAKKAFPTNREFIKKLRKSPPQKLDEAFANAHNTAFSQINCLECANCCRSLGPRITDRDIDKMARSLKIKPSELTEKHLRIDEDGDYVFKTMPCPFLESDNYCSIYANRPRACRDYPHTDRRKMVQILDIVLKNTLVCPAVLDVTERIKTDLKG